MEMAVHTIVDTVYLLKSVNRWYLQLYISAMLPPQPLCNAVGFYVSGIKLRQPLTMQ